MNMFYNICLIIDVKMVLKILKSTVHCNAAVMVL